MTKASMLIVFGGLPGAGKTTIARELARQLGAVYLRIDSIEQAIRESGKSVHDEGYRVAYALAADNLALGRTVVADSVNPLPVTRDAWIQVATRAKAAVLEIEVVCSDTAEHRRRIESRTADASGLILTWKAVTTRDYAPWDRDHIVLDTATLSVEQSIAKIRAALTP